MYIGTLFRRLVIWQNRCKASQRSQLHGTTGISIHWEILSRYLRLTKYEDAFEISDLFIKNRSYIIHLLIYIYVYIAYMHIVEKK